MREPKRLITECPHTDEHHFARGMCRECYSRSYYQGHKERIKEYAQKKREEALAWSLEVRKWKIERGEEVPMRIKGKRLVTECPHVERMHCAKGMCHECYFKSRTEKSRISAREYQKRKRDAEAARKAIAAAEALTQNGPTRLEFESLKSAQNAQELEELAIKLGVRKTSSTTQEP